MAEIEQEISNTPLKPIKDGSGHYTGPGSHPKWIYGIAMTRLYGPGRPDRLIHYPYLDSALHTIAHAAPINGSLVQVMVNRLESQHRLKPHRDGPPKHYRYHLPIVTNDECVWWDEINGTMHMQRGFWYGPVPYSGILHSFVNYGDRPRTHVIADFEPKPLVTVVHPR